jgi:chorismate mutase/prephenate dehydratase
MTIEDWRREIDAIDAELLALMNRRAQIAQQIGVLKQKTGLPLGDSRREAEVLRRVKNLNEGLMREQAIEAIFRCIIGESLRIQSEARCGREAFEVA